jgi:hypothetical protein
MSTTLDNPAQRFTFRAQAGQIDRQGGTMSDVVILEAGEARGHKMMVTTPSLEAGVELLNKQPLPAYLTHVGAYEDRLLNEIGYFSDFYMDDQGTKIKAGKFTVLPSFQKDDQKRYDRLFDLAEVMPQTFGISIVFEGELFWETKSGAVPFESFSDVPEDNLFEYPTITPLTITSADFVDTPAATSSLFTRKVERDKPTYNREMNTPEVKETAVHLDESASSELEARMAAEDGQAPPAPAPAPEPPPKKKKKLEEVQEFDEMALSYFAEDDEEEEAPKKPEKPEKPDEEEEEEPKPDPKLENRDALIAKQQTEIDELKALIDALKKVFAGSDEVEDDNAAEPKPKDKEKLIEEYIQKNPSHGRMTAILEVSKQHQELFNQN